MWTVPHVVSKFSNYLFNLRISGARKAMRLACLGKISARSQKRARVSPRGRPGVRAPFPKTMFPPSVFLISGIFCPYYKLCILARESVPKFLRLYSTPFVVFTLSVPSVFSSHDYRCLSHEKEWKWADRRDFGGRPHARISGNGVI